VGVTAKPASTLNTKINMAILVHHLEKRRFYMFAIQYPSCLFYHTTKVTIKQPTED
jgi:hypothetical protein